MPRCKRCDYAIGPMEDSRLIIEEKIIDEEYPTFCTRCYSDIDDIGGINIFEITGITSDRKKSDIDDKKRRPTAL